MLWPTDWSIKSLFYAPGKKLSMKDQSKSVFKISKELLDLLQVWNRILYILCTLIFDCIQVYFIHFFLNHCISCDLVLCSFRGLFWKLCVVAKGGVCSWRVQDHHCGVCFVIKVWLLSEFLVVSSWLRVNQYKHYVWISLSLHSLNYFSFVFINYWYKKPVVSQKQLVDFLQPN